MSSNVFAIPGEILFKPGYYEGLMLAVDQERNLTGFYREEQGEGVVKNCSFFVSGKATSDEINIATWNKEVFPGTLRAEKEGLKLKIAKGREHPGCGLVLLPQIAEGLLLDQVYNSKWVGLRVISSQRAYFYSGPDSSKKLRSFIVKGDVVGVLSENNEWLQVEYIGGKKTTKGWIHANETVKPAPPIQK
jgi:hypothetical protein